MMLRVRKKALRAYLLGGSGLLAAWAGATGTACAQGAPRTIEEVVVTATRRESLLQETPAAVTAITADDIERARIDSIEDTLKLTPNAFIYTQGGDKSRAFPVMRGSYTANDSPGTDLPVSFFVDDVYYGSSASFYPEFFDIQQIEVLRGPQGTTFGRNVTGGLIVMRSRRPEMSNSASVSVGVRNYDGFDTQGYVNGELVDGVLAGRLSWSTQDAKGYTRNLLTGKRLQGDDIGSARAQLLWRVNEQTQVNFGLSGTRDRSTGLAVHWLFVGNGPALAPQLLPAVDPDIAVQADAFNDRELWSAFANLESDLGWADLSVISTLRGMDSTVQRADAPLGVLEPLVEQDEQQFSQEVRLTSKSEGPLQWIAGAYYLRQDLTRRLSYIVRPIPGTIAALSPPAFAAQRFNSTQQRVNVESFAPFGEVVWNVTDRLALRAGARYTWEEKKGRSIKDGLPTVLNPILYDVTYSDTWESFTPRVGVEFKVTDDHFLYASYAEGFKSGGFSYVARTAADAATPLNPEKAKSMEVGARTSWFDDRLVVNVTGFKAETKNLQFQRFEPVLVTFVTANVGTQEAKGVELEVVARPIQGLTLSGSYGYVDSEYKDFKNCSVIANPAPPPATLPVDCDGNPVAGVPKETLTLAASYRWELGDAGSLTLGADFRATSTLTRASNLLVNPPAVLFEATETDHSINASAIWEDSQARWRVQAWVKNLADERVIFAPVDLTSFFMSPGERGAGERAFAVGYNEPRTFGVTVTRRFP